jgi:hypothetical protein
MRNFVSLFLLAHFAATPALFPAAALSEGIDAKVKGTNYHDTGNIPCAMTKGQPMGTCAFGVTRKGNGTADVTVKKPDGRSRVIFFQKGKAIGADVSQADPGKFSASKESDLYIIRIGQERYEIPEAVIYGG